MLTGRIVKGVAGIYDVAVPGAGRFACPARGLFRKSGISPIPGDMVVINNVDYTKSTAYLNEILPRENELIRPKSANVTQAIIVFAAKSPDPSTMVLDAMLAYMEESKVRPIICINKADIAEPGFLEYIKYLYAPAGYPVLAVSALCGDGLGEVMKYVCKPSVFTLLAGPSGVGKSSLINALFPHITQQVGDISQKIQRGKNTTRQCELFQVGQGAMDSFVADSPGFTSFDALKIPANRLQYCFPEFAPYIGKCYYTDCMHLSEHNCSVKERVGNGIPQGRYDNYSEMCFNCGSSNS